MPELPEVETIRRDLERAILNKIIRAVHIVDERVLRQPQAAFARDLTGQKIVSVLRRGKALMLELSSGKSWVVQVMMTGQLVYAGKSAENKASIKMHQEASAQSPVGTMPNASTTIGAHTRIYVEFTDGTKLLYNDQRVFGQMRVVNNIDEIKYFRIIGPEPFDAQFNGTYMTGYLKKTLRPIKSVLLDHTFVAGIGNIYACEILFRCRISPERRANRIKASEVSLLHKEITAVLQEAILHRGSSMRNYRDGAGKKGTFNKLIRVYAREGEPCVDCGKEVARIAQSGRSTFYCASCQR